MVDYAIHMGMTIFFAVMTFLLISFLVEQLKTYLQQYFNIKKVKSILKDAFKRQIGEERI